MADKLSLKRTPLYYSKVCRESFFRASFVKKTKGAAEIESTPQRPCYVIMIAQNIQKVNPFFVENAFLLKCDEIHKLFMNYFD